MAAIPVLVLPSSASESDVEQAFIWPLLTSETYLDIPADAIRTQDSLQILIIDKGSHKRRYRPDYVIYSDAIPVAIVEAKAPLENIYEGFREAQLYAHEINKHYTSELNPATKVCCTNGVELAYGNWDDSKPNVISVRALAPGTDNLAVFRSEFGWSYLQDHSSSFIKRYYPSDYYNPYEVLGENRVRLSKIGSNSFAEDLAPLLRRYFESDNQEFEDEIIEKAYVASDEITKYERMFENFLRDRISPLDDKAAQVLEPSRKEEPKLTSKIENSNKLKELPGYLQLIIGAVGAGKSTFIKRYFEFLIPPELKKRTIFVYFNFNEAPDDFEEQKIWLCNSFIEGISQTNRQHVDLEDTNGLKGVFSQEIRNKEGAYKLLKKVSQDEFDKRLASDLLKWMDDRFLFARSLSRHLGGEKGLNLVFAFDNVDTKDRDSQLRIFKTAQWFKAQTRSFCMISLRDTTFETYKTEPPLDTFIKSANFYIQPPRFVDMVRRRLDLSISSLIAQADQILEYEIEGLGKVKYPKTSLGLFLNAIYLDLFKGNRKITMILEGLAGRNARRALEMFSAILKSGHLDARDFTAAMLSGGQGRLSEHQLIRSLMRTDYLYFFESHGFIHNIYDFPPEAKVKNHILKFEVLEFLIENRKKVGDARVEGFYSVGFLSERLAKMGFPPQDIIATLRKMLLQNLIIADHMRATDLISTDLVRVHASGFIHARILSARVEYIAACCLTTPVFDNNLAEAIGYNWHINDRYTDIRHRNKIVIVGEFYKYLEAHASKFIEAHTDNRAMFIGTSSMLVRIKEALGLQSKQTADPALGHAMDTFDRLFAAKE